MLKCGCGEPAEYAVYAPWKPHCERCMKDAVDCVVQVPVRTLDPWEIEPLRPSDTPYMLFERRNKIT